MEEERVVNMEEERVVADVDDLRNLLEDDLKFGSDEEFILPRIMFLLSRFEPTASSRTTLSPELKWTDIYNEKVVGPLFQHPDYQAISEMSDLHVPPVEIQNYEVEILRDMLNDRYGPSENIRYYSEQLKALANLLTEIMRYNVTAVEEILKKYPQLIKSPKIQEYLNHGGLTEWTQKEKNLMRRLYDFQATATILFYKGMSFSDRVLSNYDNVMNQRNWHKLTRAAKERIQKQITWFVSKGATPKGSSLAAAATTGDLGLIDLLLDNVDLRKENIFYALARRDIHPAVMEHIFQAVKSRGYEHLLSEPDADGLPPIFHSRHPKMLNFFLDHNATPTAPMSKGENFFYHILDIVDIPTREKMFSILISWIEKTYLPPATLAGSLAAWRAALNKAGKDFNMRITPKNVAPLTEQLARFISNSRMKQGALLKTLELVILMGAPVSIEKIKRRCGDVCDGVIKRAFQFREKIEKAYLERPFVPNDPLYALAQASPDMAKHLRAYLRHMTLCENTGDKLDKPEVVALAKYLNIASKGKSKATLCRLISHALAEGGERPTFMAAVH